MLEAAIKIIDRIIALLKLRSARRQQIFTDFIEPLYSELTEIHRDYQESFREVVDLLEKSMTQTEVAQELKKRKKSLQYLRDKVIILSTEIQAAQANKKPWFSKELEDLERKEGTLVQREITFCTLEPTLPYYSLCL